MTNFSVNFNFSNEVLNDATDVQNEVDKILSEVKEELVGSSNSSGALDLNATLADLNKN